MAQALRQLRAAPLRREAPGGGLLRLVPLVTLAVFLAPVGAGLVFTLLPAFGHLPALGHRGVGLWPWRALFAAPELLGALTLTVATGLAATLLSTFLALSFVAACHGSRAFALLRRLLAPLLAAPHAAVALGLAFLIAPSGWIVRILSQMLAPLSGGWGTPPDLPTLPDPYGLALVLGLVIKETPYLLLMILAALEQLPAGRALATTRSLGYGPVAGWVKAVLPQLYPQIRLPIFAVLAFSLSVVDMAIVLAPATPPPLAVLLTRWFADPELERRLVAAAGATLQFGLVVGAIGAWLGGERLVRKLLRPALSAGGRGGDGRWAARLAAGGALALAAVAGMAFAGLALWSVATRWRYPAVLPDDVTLDSWLRHAQSFARPFWITLATAAASSIAALALVLGCLENEQRHGLHPTARALWLLYVPLLVPQISFLFGLQVLLAALGLDGSWPGLAWSHLLFVLPYVFLSLAEPWRTLDERYARSALCLGASPGRVFWRIKLPMLMKPVLFALAVGFSVSVAQYLPTLFAGAGRFATLATEAVTLSTGGDRRAIGVHAFLLALLPIAAFAGALLLPSRMPGHDGRRRRTGS
ncbi:MAG: ABC transporter permease [Alphaproteobacteria bacterium]|nr:MAG: ABC transporter permease [Alphaproteobacteria bacterium]